MRAIILILVTSFSLPVTGQLSNIIESNKKGLEILRKSLQAYGGAAVTDSFKLAFKMTSDKNISRGQALVPQAPFEPYFAYYNFMIDRPKGMEVENRKSSIAGFVFESSAFYKNGKGFSYDPLLKQYYDVTGNSIAVNMTYIPHNVIATALRAPLSVRYINNQLLGKDSVYFITYGIGSNLDHIYIDKKTNYLLKLERMYTGPNGEELSELYFKNYRKIGRMVMPGETDVVAYNSIHGSITNTYVFTDMKTDFTIDTTLFKVPEGYKLQDYSYRKKFEPRQLAKDVYILENITNSNSQWSYNVFFVVMDEYILVAEAPMNSATTERVISKIKGVAPGKPIKYLVQSHHHDDHLGGIRGYIAEGTTIITTANNVNLIQKMAGVRYNVYPDRLSLNPKPAMIETVKNKKHVIKDQNHEVVIYDIGPNPHANEMMIVYLPKEKIIYEADLINKGEYPLTEPGKDFLKKIKALGLQVEKIASLHGQVVEKEEVEKLMK